MPRVNVSAVTHTAATGTGEWDFKRVRVGGNGNGTFSYRFNRTPPRAYDAQICARNTKFLEDIGCEPVRWVP